MADAQYLGEDYPSADAFKKLLEQFPEDVLAKRYLLTGVPHIFKDNPLQYISFAETVGRNLDIGSHDVAIIGSSRVGFSLAPDKFGLPVRGVSDVDTVVVSERIFNEGVLEIVKALAELQESEDAENDEPNGDSVETDAETAQVDAGQWERVQQAARDVQWGFIAPNNLPNDSDFKQRVFSALNEVATQLLAMKPPGPVWKVRCRIFRTWKQAESHYASSLRRLRRDLGIQLGHSTVKLPVTPATVAKPGSAPQIGTTTGIATCAEKGANELPEPRRQRRRRRRARGDSA